MLKHQVKNRETALPLFDIYEKQGWGAFIEHPEAPTEMENILTLAVANKKTDFALKILETKPQLSAFGRPIFTTCCQTQQWDVAYALVDQTPKDNHMLHNFMASEALDHKNVDLLEHIVKRSEVKSQTVYLLLQKCANPKCSNPHMFKKLLPQLSMAIHQQDLCELFLWKCPDYAKIMLQTIHGLFDQMASHDLAPQSRQNFEIFYAEHQKALLNSSVVDQNFDKTDTRPKKI